MAKGRKRGNADSEATIGEMMFARSVIDEKNELIDQKDTVIRELASKLHGAERHLDELQAALMETRREESLIRSEEREKVLVRIVSDVVREVATVEPLAREGDGSLAARLVDLLQSSYGLSLIDEAPEFIDPSLHQVVDVDNSESNRGEIEILFPGYRLGDTVLRPALVRVALALRSAESPRRTRAREAIEGTDE